MQKLKKFFIHFFKANTVSVLGSTHVGIILKDSSDDFRKPSHLVHVVGSRATNPNLEEELVGGNMNSVMASMSCNIMSGPQVSYQLHFLRHASYVPGIRQ